MFNKLFVVLLVGVSLSLFACSEKSEQSHEEHAEDRQTDEVVTYAAWNKVCPITGDEVDNTVPTVEFNGKAYGFCCSGCDEKFSESPETVAKNLSEDGTKLLESGS